MVASYAVYSLDPARLAAVPPTEIRALQFTTSKSTFIVGVAQAVAAGDISLDQLRALPDDEVITNLVAIRGCWTAGSARRRTRLPARSGRDLGVRRGGRAGLLRRADAQRGQVRS